MELVNIWILIRNKTNNASDTITTLLRLATIRVKNSIKDISSIYAYKNAGFKIESKIPNFFMHKKNEKYIFSDKVYVSCDNAGFDLKKFYKWKPINIEDIL